MQVYITPFDVVARLIRASDQDQLALGGVCAKAGGLTSLRSFTSTIHRRSLTETWLNATELLLQESPIEVFQTYVPNSDSKGALVDTFCARFVNQHRDHLVRFSFHRQRIGLGAVEHVCISCPRLEELFVAIDYAEMVNLLPFLFWEPIHIRIIRQTLYRYLPKQRIYAQCTSVPQADRSRGILSTRSMHWTSCASVVQRFPWLESKRMSGK